MIGVAVVFIIVGSERLGIGVADRGGLNFWRWLSLIFFRSGFFAEGKFVEDYFRLVSS
jgi:hypothetical protein